MEQRTVATGVLSLLTGLLLGYGLAPSGPDIAEIEDVLGARIDEGAQTAAQGVTGMRETVATLEQKLAELAGQVGNLDGRIGETASAGADAAKSGLAELEGRLTETASELQAAISKTAEQQSSALKQAIAGLATQSATVAEGSTESDAAKTQEASTQATASEQPEGHSPGRTAILLDDAIRVFVSRVEDEAKAARLSIHGNMTRLKAGHSVVVRPDGEYCRVMLDAVDRGHARVSAKCGGDVPDPEGTSPGSVATLGDGAARVFLSQVSDDKSSARLAVNGVTVQRVEAGHAIPVSDTDCHVSVDRIDRGHVIFGYECNS